MALSSIGLTRGDLIAEGLTEKINRSGTAYFENEENEILAKSCTKCEKIVLINGFCKSKLGVGGRESQCALCKSAYFRKYRKENPEKSRESVTNYRKNNLDKDRIRGQKYRNANLDKAHERNRKYREANSKKISERMSIWHKNNPEKQRISYNLRRARKVSLPDTLTSEQWNDVVAIFGGGCALTGSTNFVREHTIPLVCGHGGTTIMNMSPMRADLNASKRSSHIFEWFDSVKERFSLDQTKFDTLIAHLAQMNEMTISEYRTYTDWCFDNPCK